MMIAKKAEDLNIEDWKKIFASMIEDNLNVINSFDFMIYNGILGSPKDCLESAKNAMEELFGEVK